MVYVLGQTILHVLIIFVVYYYIGESKFVGLKIYITYRLTCLVFDTLVCLNLVFTPETGDKLSVKQRFDCLGSFNFRLHLMLLFDHEA